MEHWIENMRLDAMQRFEARHSIGPEVARENRRDARNFESLRWLIQDGYPGRKFIIWAHNVHVMRAGYSSDFRSLHIPAQPGDMKTTGNDSTHRDSEPNGPRVPVAPARPGENPATGNPPDSHPDQTDDTAANGRNHARADAASAPSKRAIDGAVRAQMEAYARARLAEGAPITGADLDRQFGTSDYGRKVLRRLTAASGSALR